MSTEKPVDAVLEELGELGISAEVKLTKHAKVYFRVGEQRLMYVCPLTSGDHRCVHNCRAGVRRLVRQARSQC